MAFLDDCKNNYKSAVKALNDSEKDKIKDVILSSVNNGDKYLLLKNHKKSDKIIEWLVLEGFTCELYADNNDFLYIAGWETVEE